MSEFVVQIAQKTPPDRQICELTAKVTDNGVEVFAKSQVLGEFVEKVKQGSYSGLEFQNPKWASFKFYQLSGRQANMIPGHSNYSTDMFVPARGGGLGDGLRHAYDPNMVWMLAKGLENGITLVYPQPAHIPADIIEYLTKSMERVRSFYLAYILPYEAKATLVERF